MRALWTLLWLVLAAPAADAADDALQLTPDNTRITFSVRHLGVSHVEGRFKRFAGTVAYAAEPTGATIDVRIEPASVDTDLGMRDRSLRSGYFETEKFPTAAFTAAHVPLDGAPKEIEGELTLHGVTHPVTLHVAGDGDANVPLRARRRLTATTTLSRDAFGIKGTGSFLTMADEVALTIEIDLDAATRTTSPQ